ncbi:MAG: hypothetical protein SWK76_04060 [Actinomycetota bacterium]|nr:hypothetical protein [Actinomycetota bacterium]
MHRGSRLSRKLLSETAGACLGCFATQFNSREEREEAGSEMDVFRVMNGIVDGVEPGSGRLIFTPWMFRERAPVTDTTLRGSL